MPEAGVLVVPLVCTEGVWLVDWGTMNSAASLPELSTDLPQEAFQVQDIKRTDANAITLPFQQGLTL